MTGTTAQLDNPLLRFRRNVMEAWAVHAAVAADLFETLRTPRDFEQLVADTGYEPSALRALLTALIACGYLEVDPQGSHRLSEPAQRFLLRESTQYIGHALSFLRTARRYEQYPQLLREGGSIGLDDEQWSYVTRGSAMYAPLAVRALLARFPQLAEGVHSILDVGCGQGAYLLELMRHAPGSAVLGIDPNPKVVADARANLVRAGAPARIRVEQSQLAEVYEAFDVVMINQVFHVVGEAQSRDLLEAARSRLKPGGLLLVQEIVTLPDDPTPALFGFNMRMLFDQGVIFSSGELQGLVAAAGYRDVGVTEIAGPTPGLIWVQARA
jgi:SAM-dependent methyltransferase